MKAFRSALRLRLPGTLALVVCCSTIASPVIRAQSPRPMSLMDLASLQRPLDPELSPDGRFVLYSMSRPDWKLGRPVWQLWRQEVGAGAPVQLTFTDNGINPAATRWSPDGKTILFGRDGQFVTMPASGGEARPLTRHATPPSSPTWAPDASAVYFLATNQATSEERERDRLRDDLYSYGDDFRQRHLWKVTVSSGGEQAITSGDFSVLSYRLSADGRHVAMTRGPSPNQSDGDRTEVWTM